MATALFITPAYLKSVTVIDENVDEKILKIGIWRAQKKHIRCKLGTKLYDYFNDTINTSGSAGVTGEYKTLMDEYIIPALIEWAMYETMLFLLYKYRNKGVMTQSSDNAQPVDLSVLQALRDEHKEDAEEETDILVKYLCDKSTLFPEFDDNTEAYEIQPEKETFSSPIWTGCQTYYGFKPNNDIIDLNG